MKSLVFPEYSDLDSDFRYLPDFLSTDEQNKLFTNLESTELIPCPSYNNTFSRYQKWFQKDNQYFCSKWKTKYERWNSFDYLPYILELEDKVKELIKSFGISVDINSCLINKYRTGEDFIQAHRDSVDSFGEYPVIVVISLGSTRNLNFRRLKKSSKKYDKGSNRNFSFELESGSIFIMSGSSQKYFVHEIPKCDTSEVRYSFTFREFIL